MSEAPAIWVWTPDEALTVLRRNEEYIALGWDNIERSQLIGYEACLARGLQYQLATDNTPLPACCSIETSRTGPSDFICEIRVERESNVMFFAAGLEPLPNDSFR